MSLRADLIVLAPELSEETDARIDMFLGWAALRINRRVWGSKADFATLLLTAHMLTRFAADMVASVSGPVIQEKVGDLASQYGQINLEGDEELSTSTYGAQFAQMRRSIRVSPLVV